MASLSNSVYQYVSMYEAYQTRIRVHLNPSLRESELLQLHGIDQDTYIISR